MIDVLEVEGKHKAHAIATASPDDFTGRIVARADPTIVIRDPAVSLYCLDHASRRALFVRVPDGVDVTSAPFLYMAQYDHAQQVIFVPYDMLHGLAADIRMDGSMVFIHSTGRAGSTLLSKAFGEMASVTSLSEPDVYSQAVALRLAGEDDHEIAAMLETATKILFNPGLRGASLHVLKFRSYCTEIGDLLWHRFPQAGNLFLYRDLAPNLQSYLRAVGTDPTGRVARQNLQGSLATTCRLLAAEMNRRADLAGIEVIALMWLSTVHGYAQLVREGVPILAVRYEDLLADPLRTLTTILAYLGLPTKLADDGLRAFTHDSQAGTPFSRDAAAGRSGEIDPASWQLVQDLVRRYPVTAGDIPASSFSSPPSTHTSPA